MSRNVFALVRTHSSPFLPVRFVANACTGGDDYGGSVTAATIANPQVPAWGNLVSPSSNEPTATGDQPSTLPSVRRVNPIATPPLVSALSMPPTAPSTQPGGTSAPGPSASPEPLSNGGAKSIENVPEPTALPTASGESAGDEVASSEAGSGGSAGTAGAGAALAVTPEARPARRRQRVEGRAVLQRHHRRRRLRESPRQRCVRRSEAGLRLAGAENNLATWGEINACTDEAAPVGAEGCQGFSMCGGEEETLLCSVEGGSHCGSYGSFMVPEVAWEVLQRHALP